MISQHLLQSIGWTLVHSLWQGLLIFVVLKIAVRFTNRSDVRYGLGVAAMALILVCSISTFFLLNEPSNGSSYRFAIDVNNASPSAASQSVFATVSQFIDQNVIWLLRFWTLGFVVGLIRIAAGLWYIGRLRRNAHPVQDEWMDLIKKLSESLNINRVVAMAEASISSPMVVGFMKPVVLFPIGLLAGLTTEQVETILVHELSHVRRQDYIINLVQSVIETIFFFNPFVLLTSSLIREERENCCDDMVIAKGISPISYVRTLAHLEASRSSSSLALGIAGNQNQLLNRIKRIMENSAKNDWGKGRLVPVALLFLGLICASWLSIGAEAEANNTSHNVLTADTNKPTKSREEGLKVIKRGHGSWVIEEPAPLAEAAPEIEFIPDEDFAMAWEMPMDILKDFEMPPPAPDFEMFEMPEIPMAPFAFEGFHMDSIPGFYYKRSGEDWEKFEKEFTKKFKEQFKDFYEKNHEKIDKMMEDMKKDEAKRREAAEVVDLDQIHREAEQMAILQKISADAIHSEAMHNKIDAEQFLRRAERMGEQMHALDAMKADQFAKQMEMQAQQMNIVNDKMRTEALILEDMARKMDDYKQELIDMLRKDGYITKDENSLSIMEENGELTINGHKIKEKDRIKYEALRDRYFDRKRDRGYRSE